LQAVADVSVNLINKNDNFPVFQKQSNRIQAKKINRDNRKFKHMDSNQGERDDDYDYEAILYENAQPGTLVLRVSV
jgi:hypothetical protein